MILIIMLSNRDCTTRIFSYSISTSFTNFYPHLLQVRTLCQDWFPIDYPLSWYEDITSSSRFFSLAAVYNLAIIGLIVAEIKPYRNLNKEVQLTMFLQYVHDKII